MERRWREADARMAFVYTPWKSPQEGGQSANKKALDTKEKKNFCYSYHLNSARCTGAEGSSPTTWSWLLEDYCICPNQEALRQEEETLASDNNLVFKTEDGLGNII